MMTDPIADMLTRIRNSNAIERPVVEMPASGLKTKLAQVLKDEGYIIDFQTGRYVEGENGREFQNNPSLTEAGAILRVFLKYGPEGEKVIRHLERVSKPGLRHYVRHDQLRPVLDGLGIAVLSTSRGVMSDRKARTEKVGGELLCRVW
ncbi:MAG: 30S ribosomal protein S8 [Gemmataceae bacterium]